MHTIILAESALELIPAALQKESQIVREAQRARTTPDKLFLDAAVHSQLMKKLEGFQKRGRPDIPHFCTLLALDSRLNKKRGLRWIVHARGDYAIYFNPEVRIPRLYNRFCGLMSDVFEKKKIEHGGKTLISLERKTLAEIISEERAKADVAFALEQRGEKTGIMEMAEKIKGKNALFVLGGFPEGSFDDKEVKKLPAQSVFDGELCAWTALGAVLSACEISDVDHDGEGRREKGK